MPTVLWGFFPTYFPLLSSTIPMKNDACNLCPAWLLWQTVTFGRQLQKQQRRGDVEMVKLENKQKILTTFWRKKNRNYCFLIHYNMFTHCFLISTQFSAHCIEKLSQEQWCFLLPMMNMKLFLPTYRHCTNFFLSFAFAGGGWKRKCCI